MLNATFITRIIGLLVFGSGGLTLGNQILIWFPKLNLPQLPVLIISGILGALIGFLSMPSLTIRPFMAIRSAIQQQPAHMLFSAIIGIFIGLIGGAVISIPLSYLPGALGQITPIIAAITLVYLGMTITTTRADLLQPLYGKIFTKEQPQELVDANCRPSVLLDTSVIIDGRITDICRTGFIQGELVVPLFVLNELQHVADSSDTLRRNRGRRGLEILRVLQEESPVPVRITEAAVEGVREVDDKLVALAREMDASILTNDYNLNRVAGLQGVKVLNVNELANAVKTVLLPGETFDIQVIQQGKEFNQGVGYLDDGTMVVVEEGQSYIGDITTVTVSKVLQTAAGRMIFARPLENDV
ncbi:MAG: PIN domain-containing protein [Anaerolineae bacterium]|nr:PIN domain-containing protein [Anaerolineae bacterium]